MKPSLALLQLLGKPLVSREFLVAATGRRKLRGLACQLLQPVDLGLERVALSLERVAFGGQRVPLGLERVPLGSEVGNNLVRRALSAAWSITSFATSSGLLITLLF